MKASKYAEAVEVAEKWLCFEDNFSQRNYLEITEFYIKHVLLPQQLNEKVQQFLETNRALTPEQRQVQKLKQNKFNVPCYCPKYIQ